MNSSSLTLEEIKKMAPEEALKSLNSWIEKHPDNDEALVIRGQKLWNLNRRGEAISDYLQALRINPQSKAGILLDYAYSILDYYNKDLLNP